MENDLSSSTLGTIFLFVIIFVRMFLDYQKNKRIELMTEQMFNILTAQDKDGALKVYNKESIETHIRNTAEHTKSTSEQIKKISDLVESVVHQNFKNSIKEKKYVE